MQSCSVPPGSSMTSELAIHEAPVEQASEVNARLTGSIDRPVDSPRVMQPRKPLRERLRRPLLILFPVLLAAVGTAYYLAEEPYVSTDDAFVRAAKESINARVAGQVVEIAVKDNQRVRKGQLLFRIDPEPYQIAVDQAEARLGSARLQIDELKATYRQQLAELQSASDSADFDEREYARRKALVADGWTPREVYDRAETDLKVARQHIASIEQQIANTVVALNGDPNIDIDRHPTVRAAKAQLDQARLNLSYATVTAPDDGIVTRVDDLQVGDFVNPGAAVFSLMSSRRIWIEANFRETGLTHMRPGQEATIDVDAYPDRSLQGACRQHESGHRIGFRGPAAGERDRQLGQGRPASAGTPRARRDRSEPAAVLGPQCHRAGRYRLSPHLAPSAPGRVRDGRRPDERRTRTSTASRRPSHNRRRGADGDLHAGGHHLAAQCGPALYPGHAVDGRRRGRLDIHLVYRGERRHHADDALARGPLRPESRLSALDRHLRARPGAGDARDDPDAVHRRPHRPRRRERPARVRCRWRSCSICCRPRGTPASTWWRL